MRKKLKSSSAEAIPVPPTLRVHHLLRSKQQNKALAFPFHNAMAATTSTLLVARLAAVLLFSSTLCVAIRNNAGAQPLASRPPLCWNKCMGCRPCMATLVAFPRGHRSSSTPLSPSCAAARSDEEDESSYLLAWKCRCGNQLFQP